jgi:hypothetical protein
MVEAVKTSTKRRKPTEEVPAWLIYETMDGVPYYRKGYRDVLNNLKQPADIMGCSAIQWIIIEYLIRVLVLSKHSNRYRIATNEPGIHLAKGSNMSADIMVFEKSKVPPDVIIKKYIDVPALLHIEVDVQTELKGEHSLVYIQQKVSRLLAFGTGKIIWIFTELKQVLVTQSADQWHWHSWDTDIELLEGVSVNIGQYLASEGMVLE